VLLVGAGPTHASASPKSTNSMAVRSCRWHHAGGCEERLSLSACAEFSRQPQGDDDQSRCIALEGTLRWMDGSLVRESNCTEHVEGGSTFEPTPVYDGIDDAHCDRDEMPSSVARGLGV